jgi:hypothetical protein
VGLAAGPGPAYRRRAMSVCWWSIEVLDGAVPASAWHRGYGPSLVEAAITNGAVDWTWHHHRWGVLFEIAFADLDAWARFRQLPVVRAALDAVPDPINGLLIYPGRGGSAGSQQRRRPRPKLGAGAAALPETNEPPIVASPALVR